MRDGKCLVYKVISQACQFFRELLAMFCFSFEKADVLKQQDASRRGILHDLSDDFHVRAGHEGNARLKKPREHARVASQVELGIGPLRVWPPAMAYEDDLFRMRTQGTHRGKRGNDTGVVCCIEIDPHKRRAAKGGRFGDLKHADHRGHFITASDQVQ